MSEVEHIEGTLIPVEIIGNLENTARIILEEIECEKSEYYDTWLEQLEDDGYRLYHIDVDRIYRVEYEKKSPYDGVYKAKEFQDGVIEFELRYHNGGESFTEALDTALKKLE